MATWTPVNNPSGNWTPVPGGLLPFDALPNEPGLPPPSPVRPVGPPGPASQPVVPVFPSPPSAISLILKAAGIPDTPDYPVMPAAPNAAPPVPDAPKLPPLASPYTGSAVVPPGAGPVVGGPAMPGPSADADRPATPPPVNNDLFGRFLQNLPYALPVIGEYLKEAIPPETQERAASIFRLNADRAWRDNSLLGSAVSSIESGKGIETGPKTVTYVDHTGRTRTEQTGGNIYGFGYTPEQYARNAAEKERMSTAYQQRQAEKRDQSRALGPLTPTEQAASIIASLFGSALSPEIAVGPDGAAYSTASTGGKVLRSALTNAAVVGTTDPVAQMSAIERGDKKEFSPAEWATATGGAAALGAVIPALGALLKRVGVLHEAPRAPETETPKPPEPAVQPSPKVGQPEAPKAAPVEAKPSDVSYDEQGRLVLKIRKKEPEAAAAESTPSRAEAPTVNAAEHAPPEAPIVESRGLGYETIRNPDAPRSESPVTGPGKAQPLQVQSSHSPRPVSESVGAQPETARTGDAAVAPVPSPTPSRSPAIVTAAPDAPRIVGIDGQPAEVGYVASARGLPQRFATKAEAERWALENAKRIPTDGSRPLDVVVSAHPSGDGYAVAVRHVPSAIEAPPARAPETRSAEAVPARADRPATERTDAEILRDMENTLAHIETVGRRPDLTQADRAEVARQSELMRAGMERFRSRVAERDAQAAATRDAAIPVRGDKSEAQIARDSAGTARDAAEQATGARRASARLERGAEAEVASARAEVEQAQAELRRLKGDPVTIEAPAAAYNEAVRRKAPDLDAKEAQLAKIEATLARKRNPVSDGRRLQLEQQAGRLRATVEAMRRQAAPEEARISATRDYETKVRAADARVTAANERLRAAEERLAEAGARTERRGTDEVVKEYRARDAEEAAGAAPRPAADVPAHMRSDRFPGGSSTLYANPFGDPRIYRHVAPELIGALTGGFVGEYAETGKVGFSLKWALAGAFAMSGAMRLPIKGRTLLGKDSWAMRGAEKVGDAVAATPVLRSLHPRGGVTAELWDKIQRAGVETRNMQADAAGRAKYIREHFTADERALMSDWIERQEQARYGLHGFEAASAAVRGQAEHLSQHADAIGAELVTLKMLDPAAFERLKGQYLHRYYAPHQADDAPFGESARKQISATYSRRRGEARPDVENTGGFKEGDSVLQMVRPDDGETRFVTLAERRTLEAEGYVHGKTWTVEAVRDGRMDLHRDFSPVERQAMGEIRDAGYRYTRGVIEASRDLALGRLYKDIAANPEWASAAPRDGWHKVPDAKVAGSVVSKFGALSGLHVEPKVWSALMAARRPWTQFENETLNGVVGGYLKALAAWKLGKTAYNPATHFNNVTGNIALSMLSGKVGAGDVARAIGAMRRKDAIVEEARRAGLSLGHEANLGDEFGGFARELGDLTGIEPRSGWLRVMDWFTNNKVTRLYQREDSLFKLAAYMAERRAGASPEAAVKEAHKWFFDYRDVPVGVQFLRDTYAPFFTYTYKIAQALGRATIESPHRVLAAYGILSGIDMATYGFLFGDKAGAVEAYERELMPEYLKGRSALGAQRMIRLPWNVKDALTGEDRSAFLNTRYFLPGGDLLDFSGSGKFGPEIFPAVLGNTILGGNPLVVGLFGAFTGKDSFSGRDIYPYPDTTLTDWEKRPTREVAANFRALVRWFAFQALPPIVTTAPDRLGNAAVGEGGINKDGAFADFMGWTGTDYAGREKSVAKTLASVFGIKLEDIGLDEQYDFRQTEYVRSLRDAQTDTRRAYRNETRTESQRAGQLDRFEERARRGADEMQRIDDLRRAAGK